ncbi:MAG: pantetheine-phosphate adenylyltransferase [Clostridia bacterium]|nr:pantetheine-phosphate adenylyltransferase [Clostridia bacterium]
MSIAVFAGTFDPFTSGHLDIALRASSMFDKLYIAVGRNPDKGQTRFTLDERLELINDAVGCNDNIIVSSFDGLLVEYCRSVGANVIVRSIRSGGDVDYERQLECVNRGIDGGIETVFLLARPELAYLSSTLVRNMLDLGVCIKNAVPDPEHIIFANKLNGGK